MSLQVWLPLNGNINNRGISPLAINSSNASYKNGKTGQGLNLSTQINCTASGMAGATKFSVCFWSYCNIDTSKSTDWCRLVFLYDATNANTAGSGFRFETCYSSSLNSRGVSWHNNGTYAISEGSVLIGGKNEWHHICVTCETGHIKTYDNGILVNDTTATKGGHLTGQFYLGSNVTGCLNDFRLYDHCLSPKEVKEISKGLVLHYPLNNGGFGALNLVKSSLMKTTSSAYGFETRDVTVESGKQYTFSVNGCISDAAKKDGTTLKVYLYKNDWSYCPLILSISNTTNTTVTGTFTANQSTTLKITSYSFLSQGTAGSPVTINWYKLEEGLKATPWCPNSADSLYSSLGFNSNIEPDCSGFGNNGIKTGSIISNSNSPRYSSSYKFNTGIDYIKSAFTLSMPELSCSFWVKPNSSNGGYSIIASNYNNPPSGFWLAINTEGSGVWFYNGTYVKGTSLLTNDVWHHCVFTFKNGIGTWYVNGTSVISTDISNRGTSLSINNLTVGNSYTGTSWNTKNYGYISDFRFYATALSANDIEELYNSPVSIDKSGNLFAYEFMEV